MKRIIITTLLIFSICSVYAYDFNKLDPKDKTYLFNTEEALATNASGNKVELGVRFWDNVGIDLIINTGKNRVHLTGTFGSRFWLSVYYDWVFHIQEASGLALYVGAGGKVLFGNNAEFGLGANLGAEYAFQFPITLGFDWRPTWYVTDNGSYSGGDYAFMVRFRI